MLLAIETATDTCAVALHDGRAVMAEAALHRPKSHAAFLAPLVRDVLGWAGVEPSALEAVAVSAGPGSFTGLRIGASTAKGLAWASGAALVAVPTLEAVAAAALTIVEAGDVVAAALHSRRGEVFSSAFRLSDGGRLEPVRETAALAIEDLTGWLPDAPRLWLTGGAAGVLREASGGRAVRVLDAPMSAVPIARLGAIRLAAGLVEDVTAFEPAYVKAFVTRPPETILRAPGS